MSQGQMICVVGADTHTESLRALVMSSTPDSREPVLKIMEGLWMVNSLYCAPLFLRNTFDYE